MRTEIKAIFGYDPKYKEVSINKLITYAQLKKLRCSSVPYWDDEVVAYAKKHNYRTRTEAFKHMPEKKQKELIKKWKEVLTKKCNTYLYNRVDEDTKIRRLLLKANGKVELDKTPKFYSVYPYFAKGMYSSQWSSNILFNLSDKLINNSVYSVVYLDDKTIKIKFVGVGSKGLTKAIDFWKSLPSSVKKCEEGYCARIQGATFDIAEFRNSISNYTLRKNVSE